MEITSQNWSVSGEKKSHQSGTQPVNGSCCPSSSSSPVSSDELQSTSGPLPCHSASSAFAKRALAEPQILTTKHCPAATVLHMQPASTLNGQDCLLLCEGGTAVALRLKSSAPLAQLVPMSVCTNLYMLSHVRAFITNCSFRTIKIVFSFLIKSPSSHWPCFRAVCTLYGKAYPWRRDLPRPTGCLMG